MPGFKVLRLAIAGPGQSPPIPQPTPNNTAPVNSFLSTLLLEGIAKLFSKTGAFLN